MLHSRFTLEWPISLAFLLFFAKLRCNCFNCKHSWKIICLALYTFRGLYYCEFFYINYTWHRCHLFKQTVSWLNAWYQITFLVNILLVICADRCISSPITDNMLRVAVVLLTMLTIHCAAADSQVNILFLFPKIGINQTSRNRRVSHVNSL